MTRHISLTVLTIVMTALAASSQARFFKSARVADAVVQPTVRPLSVADSLLDVYADDLASPFMTPLSLPDAFFLPPVYDTFRFDNSLKIGDKAHSDDEFMRWSEDQAVLNRQMVSLRRNLYFNHPELVHYTLEALPDAPQQYQAVIDPSDFTISVTPAVNGPEGAPTIAAPEIKKRHWIRTFNASLQFSQAYVSPNWYQGGNDNLNALANIYYNVKLNQEYHPNLLFETTAQYKLGMNNAPDDSIHSYNVSEDVLQINTTFGVKAAHRWYYSFTGQFKTQILSSYKSNSRELRASFLSPGELTAGIGMTYNYANKRKTFNFDASVAPLSYNLRTCITDRIDHGLYDIKPDRKTVSKFGSSAELKLAWKITYNIQLLSRIFAFTDYDSFQADWENTLSMDINRFLSTQIYVHARYDSSTPREPDSDWHKLQVKEIFSIGFSYKFASI